MLTNIFSKRVVITSVLLASSGLFACGAGAGSYVRNNPPTALASCPADQVQIERVGDTNLFYVNGCNEVVRYVPQCNAGGLCMSGNQIVISRSLRRQAAFDLKCDQDIALTRLGRDTFGATGCERNASYALVNCGTGECTVVQNTQTQ